MLDAMEFIYSKLEDEQSKQVFNARLQFAYDQDLINLFLNIKGDHEFHQWSELGRGEAFDDFFRMNRDAKIIIYGAGKYGRLDYNILKACGYDIFAFGDSNPGLWGQEICGCRVLSDVEIMREKEGMVFVVGSPLHAMEIYSRLLVKFGIKPDKVYIPPLNYLRAAHGWQYFDFFEPGSDEVFVDAGSYNGNTAIEFTRWCPEYKDIYMFEASQKQEQFIVDTMENNGINKYHLFMKGISDCKKEAGFIDSEDGSYISIGGGSAIGLISLDEATLCSGQKI